MCGYCGGDPLDPSLDECPDCGGPRDDDDTVWCPKCEAEWESGETMCTCGYEPEKEFRGLMTDRTLDALVVLAQAGGVLPRAPAEDRDQITRIDCASCDQRATPTDALASATERLAYALDGRVEAQVSAGAATVVVRLTPEAADMLASRLNSYRAPTNAELVRPQWRDA